MNRGTLRVRLSAAEGALLRTLVVVGGRGFGIVGLHARRGPDCTEVALEVESATRPFDVLVRQIRRLHDVELVDSILSSTTQELPWTPTSSGKTASSSASSRPGSRF